MNRRTFIRAAIAAAVAVVPMFGIAAAYRFVIERHERRLPGLAAPLRVGFATDLHFGPYIRAGSVATWVDANLAGAVGCASW